ncbi:putative ABC transport system ATP-binding protein/lipoprotein-releasing system ATP-binding protein [Paenibacillus cellulosilyticus]|uniref:Putative ABC transport system ATP-binding protein/lipoprotein-releasing system ATP-binding protein n=1 Tax=Paenibacillus cellulosilyticus TaxID=375489 RepID=A0A2V2YY98_9BACL|nr:ABC transporter ATP-binding protein [Paenibacillus cellulosilyticus]PWW07243.1 putative ABC transport system ATP-binding protein/lipoprotein-releasing system ATP-binding protein [Paenibacillus cellulosilyticus]QKS44566.1 ABC transporter ATP-binding protein [Paenibacillus cellulosilyticus]
MSLTLINVKKQYNNVLLFDHVSLKANPGEIIALKGKSGTGKSTLLNIIAGLEKPSSGEILLNELSFSEKSVHELSRVRREYIGYISQHTPLIPKLTVLDNITIPLHFIKKSEVNKEIMARIDEYAALLEIKNLYDNKIEQLSGGEQQRVGIIRALLHNPNLVVADEPTASLDDETSALVFECFNHLKSKGAIILLSTHHAAIAAKCDSIYLLTPDGLVLESPEISDL